VQPGELIDRDSAMLERGAETVVGRQGAEAATSTRRSSAIDDNAWRVNEMLPAPR